MRFQVTMVDSNCIPFPQKNSAHMGSEQVKINYQDEISKNPVSLRYFKNNFIRDWQTFLWL